MPSLFLIIFVKEKGCRIDSMEIKIYLFRSANVESVRDATRKSEFEKLYFEITQPESAHD